MNTFTYDRLRATNYALEYALKRNPNYYNFDKIGGNCTNFVSQAIFAGCGVMNFSPLGWYNNSANDRSPSWTGVDELRRFLLTNKYVGPFAAVVEKTKILIGDVVQLGKKENDFFHTMIITKIQDGRLYVCSNTRDAKNVPLEYYSFSFINFIHIEGYRK